MNVNDNSDGNTTHRSHAYGIISITGHGNTFVTLAFNTDVQLLAF